MTPTTTTVPPHGEEEAENRAAELVAEAERSRREEAARWWVGNAQGVRNPEAWVRHAVRHGLAPDILEAYRASKAPRRPTVPPPATPRPKADPEAERARAAEVGALLAAAAADPSHPFYGLPSMARRRGNVTLRV